MKFSSIILAVTLATSAAMAQNSKPISSEADTPKEIVKTQPWEVKTGHVNHPLLKQKKNVIVLTNSRSFTAACDPDRKVVEFFVAYDSYDTVKTIHISYIDTKNQEDAKNNTIRELSTYRTRHEDVWVRSFVLEKTDWRISRLEDLRFAYFTPTHGGVVVSKEDRDDWIKKATYFRTMCQLTVKGEITNNTTELTDPGLFVEIEDNMDHINVIMQATLNPTRQVVQACQKEAEYGEWYRLSRLQETFGVRRCYINLTPERYLDGMLRKIKFVMGICSARRLTGTYFSECVESRFK